MGTAEGKRNSLTPDTPIREDSKPRILHPWPDVRFAVTHPR